MQFQTESEGEKTPSKLSEDKVSILELQKNWMHLDADKRDEALKEFWNNIEKGAGTPIVELTQSGNYTITFLYRSEEEVTVELDCIDLNEQKLDPEGKVRILEKVPGTDIYMFKVENIPAGVVIPYGFTVTGLDGSKHDINDRLNKKSFQLPLCNRTNGEIFLDDRNSSVLSLPNADLNQTWLKGEISEQQGILQTREIDAVEQGFGKRSLWVYTPADFNPERKELYKLMVITDGETYAKLLKPHLDQQQLKNPLLQDTVVAFVGNVREGSTRYFPPSRERNDTVHRQYEFIEHSQEFYTAVIAPAIESLRQDPSLHLSHKAEDTILGGFSLGGHFAVEAGLTNSENIGNVISLSGAFNTSLKSLASNLEEQSPKKPRLNIFMSIGQLETANQTTANQAKFNVTEESRLEANLRVYNTLQTQKHQVKLEVVPSGHNELSTLHLITDQALPFVCANSSTKDYHSEESTVASQSSEGRLATARQRMKEFKAVMQKNDCPTQDAGGSSLKSPLKTTLRPAESD